MFRRLSVLLIVAFLLAACLPSPTGTPGQGPTPVPPATEPPPTVEPTHVPVDLTPAQLAALRELMAQRGLTADQVRLVSTEAVEWPDGCLGIARPEASCLAEPVQGFRILLAVGEEQVEVRTNQDGSVVAVAEPATATLRIAILAADGSVQIVDTTLAGDPANPPAANGLLPRGGLAGGTVFALPYDWTVQAVSVDPDNPTYPPAAHALDFVVRPNYALAVWPGDAGSGPALAWGTQIDAETGLTTLVMAAPDGSMLDVLVEEDGTAAAPHELLAQRWAADGRALYYSREPSGIGGYILFGGASSLYRVSLDDGQITEYLPFDAQGGPAICLDALSPDYTAVAGHCTAGVITVRNLQTGESASITPPAEVGEFGALGSARFSPDGSRVAYALAANNPEAEQGWVAVSDGLSGGSTLVATSQPGQYFNVAAWLNSDTLLVQSNGLVCDPACPNELWTLNVTDGTLLKVADGTFVSLVDGYQP